ncbi:MAG: glycosyltransferase [Opitutaceae bacterium]|nr:glycosyltransferase [Cytophagales bacterium]
MTVKRNNLSKVIQGPKNNELLTLRFIIFIGICSTFYFLFILLNPKNIGHQVFYWILMSTIIFSCLQALHEWYHYFSISVPEPSKSDKKYTVDILTTFCAGEPYSMIIETLEAIQKITYPHTTYLGDEANDPFLIKECKRLGVHHITRNNRLNAKSGNVNNILNQSSGELCVVLDPDHIPTPDLLDHVIPHFEDPKVGFIQIVQAYYNIGENLIAKGAAQQTFQFYGPMMMTMNSYGTVMAIGANCTFRRTALDSIGGHAAGLAEDMHTAMQLHAKGWISKYVPAVLTRGLVPSSLSAYYKQQLKWSRGVFELFVTSYPRLFKNFTWRQKLHYGSIPVHYFSGVIYFLNFLIPVCALIFDFIPFKMDMLEFAVAGLPLLVSTIMIRHYVQRWVTEEKERGFHVVGGLLLIGTWWIYILGFVFTVIRRKVPYDPTPKDGSDPNNWGLNVPNIIVGVISLLAIIYGLSIDYTPYKLAMAGLALLNCFFMLFVVIASRQTRLRRFKNKYRHVESTVKFLVPLKVFLYKWRHKLYKNFRRLALPIVLLGCSVSFFYSKYPPTIYTSLEDKYLPPQTNFLFKGVFDPLTTNGLSSISKVKTLQSASGIHMDIISLYLPWGDGSNAAWPIQLIDSIYQLNSIPMITWEPWGSNFSTLKEEDRNEKKIFKKISTGVYDNYLFRIALEFKNLNKPVFLRFAHEPDNPSYPWSSSGSNNPEEYRSAWKYVKKQFSKAGAHNVIWVWNPWKAEGAEAFFPGTDQVDWLAVTILNYGPYNPDKKWYSFTDLYNPFLNTKPFKLDLPVMIAEMGSLFAAGNQQNWFKQASVFVKKHPNKIKAVIFFNNSKDLNVPGGQSTSLEWSIKNIKIISLFKLKKSLNSFQYSHEKKTIISPVPVLNTPAILPFCRGINYTKGQNWFRNFHTLSMKVVSNDMMQIKSLGANTIKVYGPTVYERNILNSAKQENLKIIYSLEVPKGISFLTDTNYLNELSEKILSSIKRIKDDPSIIGWNISCNALEDAHRRFHKPASLYHRYAYANWLLKLAVKINAISPDKPLTVDVYAYVGLDEDIEFLHSLIPQISAFGIRVDSDSTDLESLENLTVPYFFTKISASKLSSLNSLHKSAFISDWQDTWSTNKVTFDGLIDHWGRRKQEYYNTSEIWKHSTRHSCSIPSFKILKSANLTYPNTTLTYNAVINKEGQWCLAKDIKDSNLQFEWHLILLNEQGIPKELIDVGKGPVLELKIPKKPHLYKLYLIAYSQNETQSIINQLVLWPSDSINTENKE